eukprot:1147367-Pelagomonas_calceolata.AAC.6
MEALPRGMPHEVQVTVQRDDTGSECGACDADRKLTPCTRCRAQCEDLTVDDSTVDQTTMQGFDCGRFNCGSDHNANCLFDYGSDHNARGEPPKGWIQH